ncbi:MAG TPA: ornithine carbamoyltransferase [Gemmatimonadaceae bacterium]|nr:ornithine carbamoyltransferase [Gemmatimonadaceae bacterium]
MTDRKPRPHRDFLTIPDFTRPELEALFVLAERMRAGDYSRRPLTGKSLAMVFTKSSTRTRVSFEVGACQLGAQALFLSARDVQLGRGEPIADTARVLSRLTDGIVIRTARHQEIEDLAKHADVPVIDGLTDWQHPCQVLADLLTIRQFLGSYDGKRIAWVGDGNNMANSWLDAAYVLGFDLTLACPAGYEPDPALLKRAKKRAKVTLVRDPARAIDGAHVVNTDVWASMGQEDQAEVRNKAFAGYTVNAALMKRASRDAIFLHCLPAHRGQEVSGSVIDGPRSRVWDQAENRLHIQKAILAALMGGEKIA